MLHSLWQSFLPSHYVLSLPHSISIDILSEVKKSFASLITLAFQLLLYSFFFFLRGCTVALRRLLLVLCSEINLGRWGGPYVMTGIKSRSIMCKANILPAVLTLAPSSFILKAWYFYRELNLIPYFSMFT